MQFAGLELSLPIVMGILNITPDSFSDGGDLPTIDAIAARAGEFCEAGAKILDIGGESTRPGSTVPPLTEELNRVIPAIRAVRPIADQYGVKISIDTRRQKVMQAAVEAGADIINDVSALETDPHALPYIAQHQLPVILCHMQGTPDNMQAAPRYNNVVQDVHEYFSQRIAACLAAGLARENICIDPGIGFGKTLQHNVELLRNLSVFQELHLPLLVGLSRKRMIAELTGEKDPKRRLGGSLAGTLFAAANGAHILRVHDARDTCQALAVWRGLTADNPAGIH